ncbi:MAG: hypothetical protein CVU57_03845 [Deltaproteobacteria bacterium HGW-Deltaproteobacteria-15]|jgi:hypothetical protein|nr:MAG: hypothetical protein CVU57_03845 [Deltaproteobacteria bacterium HGW-Deltaproteobacteria-15]
MEQNTGAAATVSLIAAILSWIITFTGHPIWGMILGLVAIPAGLIGALMAASPRVGGGLLSVIGIVIGILGLGLAVLGLIGVILF